MPQIFGTEHIIFMLVSVAVMVTALVLIGKFVKKERTKRVIIITCALIQLTFIIWNRLAVMEYGGGISEFLPTTFCATTSLLFPLAMIFCKKDSGILQFLASCMLLGGVLTFFYPDFIGQDASIFFDKTMSGLLHHTMGIFNFLLICVTGSYKPSMEKWNSLIFGLCAYMTYGIFMISMLGHNDAMYIYHPLIEGTIFNWVFVGAMFIILYTIALIVYEQISLKKEDRWVQKTYNKLKIKFEKLKK